MHTARVLAALCLVMGCAADAHNDEYDADVDGLVLENAPADWCSLNGRWRTLCNPGQAGAIVREVIFDCGVMSYIQYEYADAHCDELRNAVEFDAAFRIGSPLADDTSVYALDASIFDSSITPLDAHSAEELNRAAVCDREDWTAGISRDLGNCDHLPGMHIAQDTHVYATVVRLGRELTLSDGSNGPVLTLASTPEERPEDTRGTAYNTYFLKDEVD